MNRKIKDKLPLWYKELNNTNVIITNDIDSLMGFHFLNKIFDVEINGFCDFSSLYMGYMGGNRDIIGMDFDTLKLPTFGNHITHFYQNINAINLNNVFDIRYYQKYPLSTTILILSLYDFDLMSFSDEQLKIILAIDAGFKGYYPSKPFFRDVYTQWLDRLGIRFLENRILQNMTRLDFYDVIERYNLYKPIEIDNQGYLYTDIDLEAISKVFGEKIALPRKTLKKISEYRYLIINPWHQAIPPKDQIVSMAWTSRNTLKMSLRRGA